MSRTFNGSSHYLSVASSPIGSSPAAYTFSCWVNGAAQDFKCVMALGRSTDANPIIGLFTGANAAFGHSTSTAFFYIRNDAGTNINTAAFTGTMFDSTWRHIAVRWDGASMAAIVSGSGSGDIPLTPGTITLDRFGIGALVRNTVGLYFNGSVAEPALWNAALSDSEMARGLAQGASPKSIRPQSLVFYPPLIRDVQDVRAATAITDNGPSTVGVHPRIYA